MTESELPKTVFKYQPYTIQSLLNLKKQSIYFGSPKHFNDPYDCATTAIIAEPTDDETIAATCKLLSDPEMTPEVKNKIAQSNKSSLIPELKKAASIALEHAHDNYLSTMGVTCFAERNDNLLMWSHYGEMYKGFCLEFRTEYQPFDKLKPVAYSDTMPATTVASVIVDEDADKAMDDLYCTKSIDWAYEQEWRGFHKDAGTVFTYEASALKAVYFGPQIDQSAMEIVCLILAGQNPDVELWRGARSSSEFKVVFEKFDYITHVEAKKQGRI